MRDAELVVRMYSKITMLRGKGRAKADVGSSPILEGGDAATRETAPTRGSGVSQFAVEGCLVARPSQRSGRGRGLLGRCVADLVEEDDQHGDVVQGLLLVGTVDQGVGHLPYIRQALCQRTIYS